MYKLVFQNITNDINYFIWRKPNIIKPHYAEYLDISNLFNNRCKLINFKKDKKNKTLQIWNGSVLNSNKMITF